MLLVKDNINNILSGFFPVFYASLLRLILNVDTCLQL